MKYNKNDQTTKPESECPRTCGECPYFIAHSLKALGGTCTANNDKSNTNDFSRPDNRPLPQPLNCCWWYTNRVLSNLSEDKQKGYMQQRLHELAAARYREELDDQERRDFVKHCFRPGGGRLIDFTVYPEAFKFYQEICKISGIKSV